MIKKLKRGKSFDIIPIHVYVKMRGLSWRLETRLLIALFLVSIFQHLNYTISQAQSLEEYLVISGENNPELKASFSEYLAALERVAQAGALPDPELSLGLFLKPMERYMGNQLADATLMQMFPWFGTLRTRKDEASKMALAKYELFQETKSRLFYQVKDIYYQLYRLEEEIKITEENLRILQTFERLALTRFKGAGGDRTNSTERGGNSSMSAPMGAASVSSGSMVGDMKTDNPAPTTRGASGTMGSSNTMNSGQSDMSDVLLARIEVKELENQLEFLRASLLPLQAEFNQLLNRDLGDSVGIPDKLSHAAISLGKEALLDTIIANNPMLKMLTAEGEAYDAQLRMASLMGKPMLGAGINYMPFSSRPESGMMMGGKDMIMPMLSVTIPIYRKKSKAMVSEAELMQQSTQARRENAVNELVTRWAIALRDLDDATRKIGLYQEQEDLVKQMLNLLVTGYSADGRDFEEVLSAQQQLLDYRLNRVYALVKQHTAIAMLEMLAGTDGLMMW